MNLSLQLEKNNREDINYNLSRSLNDPLLYDDKLLESLEDLNLIQKNLSSLVASQQDKIDTIEANMTKTEMNTLEGIKDLQEADKLYFSYKPIIIGGALGAVIGGPLGAAVGVKWVTLTGGIGTFLGSYGGYKLQKL